jgi:uncharacterized protein (DUF58 family)
MRLRPTGLWLLFGPILACMWMAAINYSNNLVYGILYLIGSLTFVSLFHTWRNLAALEVDDVRLHSAFAGEEIRLELHLRNPTPRKIFGLFFARLERGSRRALPLPMPAGGLLRLDAADTRTVNLFFPAMRRGRYRLDSIIIRSSYPFGLVYASYRLRQSKDYYVYPALRGETQLPELHSSGEHGIPVGPKPGDDFAGVRAYSPGESLRHVDWKAYARGRPLSVKQFTGGDDHELLLDAATLDSLPIEERLSQLALWIVTAEKEDLPYSLHAGNLQLPLGLGATQAQRALEILAEVPQVLSSN